MHSQNSNDPHTDRDDDSDRVEVSRHIGESLRRIAQALGRAAARDWLKSHDAAEPETDRPSPSDDNADAGGQP